MLIPDERGIGADVRRWGSDALAGVTLALLAVPEVLGYARIAGMPVVTGLYTMLLPMVANVSSGSAAGWPRPVGPDACYDTAGEVLAEFGAPPGKGDRMAEVRWQDDPEEHDNPAAAPAGRPAARRMSAARFTVAA